MLSRIWRLTYRGRGGAARGGVYLSGWTRSSHPWALFGRSRRPKVPPDRYTPPRAGSAGSETLVGKSRGLFWAKHLRAFGAGWPYGMSAMPIAVPASSAPEFHSNAHNLPLGRSRQSLTHALARTPRGGGCRGKWALVDGTGEKIPHSVRGSPRAVVSINRTFGCREQPKSAQGRLERVRLIDTTALGRVRHRTNLCAFYSTRRLSGSRVSSKNLTNSGMKCDFRHSQASSVNG